MAERSSKGNSSNQGTRRENVVTDTSGTASKVEHSAVEKIPECAVCLQTCVHPVQLPCSHIFCFLCVKGAANQSSRCALCRQGIPVEFFNNPTLVGKKDVSAQGFECDAQTETYAWFYEGRNGWWQYDERTNAELEESYNAKKRTFELLIAGFMYVIDLDNMVQMRRNDPSRRRRIKRDLVSAPKKGIAGLKIAARLEATAETVEVPQTAKKEKDETAAGEMPSTASGTLVKAATSSGLGRTTSRSAGVGRDQEHGDPRSVPSDQYDADDDYDGTDDEDTNSAQWRSQQEPTPRFRPQQRGSRLAGNARDPPAGTRQLATSGARAQPQGLPVRHQRVSSAPETRPGRHERHRQALVDGSNPLPQRADSAHVESAMQSLQLSTPNASVYEAVEAPSQPAQGEVRQRRRRQRQNDDIWC